MRLLAEFILRGRVQAVAIAFLGVMVFLPLLSHAAIGLVTLRRGYYDGLLVLFAAFAANFVLLMLGTNSESQQLFALGAPLVTFIGALMLRSTVSWPLTVLTVMAASAVAAALMVMVHPVIAEELSAVAGELLNAIAEKNTDAENPVSEELRLMLGDFSLVKTAGLFAFFIVWTATVSLFLARWLQSLLFNPGGFQQEFHHFRLNTPVTLGSVVAALLLEFQGFEFAFWASVCLTPLMMAGLSLVHYMLKRSGFGYAGVVAFYGLLVIAPPLVILATIMFGASDTWVNYRNRFQFKR